MSGVYLTRQTVRTFTRAGFDIVGTAAIRRGVVVVRRDSAWLVGMRGAMSHAVSCPTTHSALAEADRQEHAAEVAASSLWRQA